MTPEKPVDADASFQQPPQKGTSASKAEDAVRRAPDAAVAPHEKRAIGEETSREEDA